MSRPAPTPDGVGRTSSLKGHCGLEWEQGAVPAGAPGPQWYRFGMCDHGNAYQSAVAVLQAFIPPRPQR